MQVIALYSMKGGVGKTTTCVNLAYLAAEAGYVSLVWDLDPQGAASFYLGENARIKGGAKKIFGKDTHLGNHIRPTRFDGLDILPADLSYRNLDLLLDELKKSKRELRRLVGELKTEYSYVFIDCPPVLGVLAEHIFEVADILLFPLIPTTLSERAFDKVKTHLKGKKDFQEKMVPFFTLVDSRKRMHRDVQITFSLDHPHTLSTPIPNSSIVEQMGVRKAPLHTYAPNSPAAEAFMRLWGEVQSLSLRGMRGFH